MLKHFDEIEEKIAEKIYKLNLAKFNGNNSQLALLANCSETTVRRVFAHKQRMTLNLFLRFCKALDVDVADLLKEVDASTNK